MYVIGTALVSGEVRKGLVLICEFNEKNLHRFYPPIPKPSTNQNQSPAKNIAEYKVLILRRALLSGACGNDGVNQSHH